MLNSIFLYSKVGINNLFSVKTLILKMQIVFLSGYNGKMVCLRVFYYQGH